MRQLAANEVLGASCPTCMQAGITLFHRVIPANAPPELLITGERTAYVDAVPVRHSVAVIVDHSIGFAVDGQHIEYKIAGAILHHGTALHGHYRALNSTTPGTSMTTLTFRASDPTLRTCSNCDVPYEVAMLRYSRV